MLTEIQYSDLHEKRESLISERIRLNKEIDLIDENLKEHFIDKVKSEVEQKFGIKIGDKVSVTYNGWNPTPTKSAPMFLESFVINRNLYCEPTVDWVNLFFNFAKGDGTKSLRTANISYKSIIKIEKI